MKKRLQVIVSLFSVIITAFTMTSLTLAWINTNKQVDRVTIRTGEGKFEVLTGMYKRQYSGLTSSLNSVPDFYPTINEGASSNLALVYNFEDRHDATSAAPLPLLDLVHNEHALNALVIPTYVIELRIFTLLDASFIKISINELAYATPAFKNYEFRYLIANNTPATPLTYAAQANRVALEAKTPQAFNGTTPVYFTDGAGAFNQHEINSPSEYKHIYSEYFLKSILVMINPSPIAYYNYIKNNTAKGTTGFLTGIKTAISIEFNEEPFDA